jgi:hypothetical protein
VLSAYSSFLLIRYSLALLFDVVFVGHVDG